MPQKLRRIQKLNLEFENGPSPMLPLQGAARVDLEARVLKCTGPPRVRKHAGSSSLHFLHGLELSAWAREARSLQRVSRGALAHVVWLGSPKELCPVLLGYLKAIENAHSAPKVILCWIHAQVRASRQARKAGEVRRSAVEESLPPLVPLFAVVEEQS